MPKTVMLSNTLIQETTSASSIGVFEISHRYGDRLALNQLSFEVHPSEIFGLLGPNGGGKTTLFRLLSTLLPLQSGTANIAGLDLATESQRIRNLIGVTFQSPSLDGKLTVQENLKHQAHLYGISGALMRERIENALKHLGLTDRKHGLADSLSGGLKRRVEIAKGLLHAPQVLLLDEPSTGLDPGARHDLWKYLKQLQREDGVTILITTHLMEEAEQCDRLGILHQGELVALGTPDKLRASVGGDCLTIHSEYLDELQTKITEKFSVVPQIVNHSLRLEHPRGHEFLKELIDAFPQLVTSVSLGKPTLEDVFIHETGHQFWQAKETV
ncbi:ATP-binding cassette domain-containing protein [Gimesia aquarii]|uniref:Putative ABC transporter ATP-binding protein YbhF n=1 Tax=Gimesia aquarii TaxID=2527964 RepID=A0A517WUD9_9PLAN|nr:ATP-binding cassette domain-containing protein [Gimesia aquarii]QDU08879.1 putative ABC transporter ATP-binding protein YbhF [Gimesia aquarii]